MSLRYHMVKFWFLFVQSSVKNTSQWLGYNLPVFWTSFTTQKYHFYTSSTSFERGEFSIFTQLHFPSCPCRVSGCTAVTVFAWNFWVFCYILTTWWQICIWSSPAIWALPRGAHSSNFFSPFTTSALQKTLLKPLYFHAAGCPQGQLFSAFSKWDPETHKDKSQGKVVLVSKLRCWD